MQPQMVGGCVGYTVRQRQWRQDGRGPAPAVRRLSASSAGTMKDRCRQTRESSVV